MQKFPKFTQHVAQAKNLATQRANSLQQFSVEASWLMANEQQTLKNWHAIITQLNEASINEASNIDEEEEEEEDADATDAPLPSVDDSLQKMATELLVCHPERNDQQTTKALDHFREFIINAEENTQTDCLTCAQMLPMRVNTLDFDALLSAHLASDQSKKRQWLFTLARDCAAKLSQKTCQQALQSPDPKEQQAAAAIAKYQSHLPISCFDGYQSQPHLIEKPALLAERILGARFRGDTSAAAHVFNMLNRAGTSHYGAGHFPLFRSIALCEQKNSVPLLQRFAKDNPADGPWLLVLHGKRNAIEALITLINHPATAPAAIKSWQWLSGQKLPVTPGPPSNN